jgi:predicted dehydrogenase/threonine dehydrogenase-like Zn-dependent dehydrogenase
MKQVLQNMRDGKTSVAEVPAPLARPGTALVRTAVSLVSAGTERMLVEFAEKSLLGKAQSRPDLVRQLLEKARREGLLPTLQAAFNRLDQPMVLGYSSTGTIVEVGKGLKGFKPGDRVACAGGNFAVHAEYGVVPQNLLVPLPETVDFESAAFTTLGAIALHGFRLANPKLDERVAIIGLGLLGLLAVGIARAAGCQVFGTDLSLERVELARAMGIRAVLRGEAEEAGRSFSQGQGFDVVLICADARSNDPIELAGVLARDRGQVIAVGAVGLEIPRKIYYEKELHFQVSRSYGPGRYDPAYEENGRDYPAGFVRWTEGRNLQAIVDLLASGQLELHPLISHRYPIERASEAYDLITGKSKEPFLGVLLTYPQTEMESPLRRVDNLAVHSFVPAEGELALGVLGAGLYANATFLPAVEKVGGVSKIGIASAAGVTAHHSMQKYGFRYAASAEQEILTDQNINLLAILTRHNSHARLIMAGLKAGKHIYCEKPLAIHPQELDELQAFLAGPNLPVLMAGFNRRFGPFAVRMKSFLEGAGEPFVANYRVNAGLLPLTHWLHDPQVGGGRIIGEGCHFVDFLSFLAGAAPVSASARALADLGRYNQDNVVITLTFPDGSLGTIHYLANGDKSFPKEQVEVFCAGRVAVLDDFRTLQLARGGQRQILRDRFGQDKGHRSAWQAFLQAVRSGGPSPIPYDQMIGVTRATFEAVESLRKT